MYAIFQNKTSKFSINCFSLRLEKRSWNLYFVTATAKVIVSVG